jgi:exonuclease SbcD
LGKTLEGRSRLPEQEAFIAELCRIVQQEQVDVVLVAGDIFDTPNPPAAAEQLFYEAVDRLAEGGRRGVVVIAGNHDNPERLCASGPLANRHGIVLLGVPADSPVVGTNIISQVEDKVRIIAGGPAWLELAIPGCIPHAVILALPYPSEARLKELLVQSLDEEALQQAYSERVGSIFTQLAANYRPDTVNLAMSHLFVLGGVESEGSERPINLGGACTVNPAMLPAAAQYIALGHLHRPQRVGGTSTLARYSGSALGYSFSEAGQAKSVILVEAEPGEVAVVKEITLSSGYPLVKWQVRGGLEEALRWIEEGRDEQAWLELELHLQQPLSNEENHLLRSLRPQILNIRPVLPGMEEELVREQRSQLSIDELFRRFFAKQTGGGEPDSELVKLFLELVNMEDSVGEEQPQKSEEQPQKAEEVSV